MLTNMCFSADALLGQALYPFMSALLATKLRYHQYFVETYGEDNPIVSVFESACRSCGLTRETIYEWGKLVDDEVKRENVKNLAMATAGNKDTAEELANLKAHQMELTKTVEDQSVEIKELKGLLETVTTTMETNQAALLEAISRGVDGGGARSTNTLTSDVPTADEIPGPPAGEMAAGEGGLSARAAAITPFTLSKKRKATPTTSIAAPTFVDHGLIVVAAGKLTMMKTTEFLWDLSTKNLLNKLFQNGRILYKQSFERKPLLRLRMAIEFLKKHAGSGVWQKYLATGKEYKAALSSGQAEIMGCKKSELYLLCNDLLTTGARAYWNLYKETQLFAQSKLEETTQFNSAKNAFETIGFGTRIEKLYAAIKKEEEQKK